MLLTARILISAVILLLMALVFIRHLLKKKTDDLDERISEARPADGLFPDSSYPEAGYHFYSISQELEEVFPDTCFTYSQRRGYVDSVASLVSECEEILPRLKTFHVKCPDRILGLIEESKNSSEIFRNHNEKVLAALTESNREFFDHCLRYPLDAQQRRAIVSEEDNCLVVSSAGSGKTSSIVGKVRYLVEKMGVPADRILLISYTNKAASELTERMAYPGLRGYTFHKLALDIIGRETGMKPSICDNTDALFVEVYRELVQGSEDFRQGVLSYFTCTDEYMAQWEKDRKNRQEELSKAKSSTIEVPYPDMDGRRIRVRSLQERDICIILTTLGVDFRYEEPYEHQVADGMHSQYRPDFSIHFSVDGQPRRLYLEHFGVDERGLVPQWFAKDRGISYEEANARYSDGIEWKRSVHEKYSTSMAYTTSADFTNGKIRERILGILKDAGVHVSERTSSDLYAMSLAEGDKTEKAFIRLVATFITLLKSSCRSMDEVLSEAEKRKDDRALLVIGRVFAPVYRLYCEKLAQRGQIDFTDAILKATEICRTLHHPLYDHIIVDEFQDISVDRYEFLKALRGDLSTTKLFCVGDDWQSIYRFSGSDMALLSCFTKFFGPADICKIETTYRFGNPLVGLSGAFIQKNPDQIRKDIRPFSSDAVTTLSFKPYRWERFSKVITEIVDSIPPGESIFLLGRYSFDDYYLSKSFESRKEGGRFYYLIS